MQQTDNLKLKQMAADFTKGLLGSRPSNQMCFAVCTALAGYLNFSGYHCRLTEGKVGKCEHYWLTLPDGTVLDPTADQFKQPSGDAMPRVYVGEKPEWYKISDNKGRDK